MFHVCARAHRAPRRCLHPHLCFLSLQHDSRRRAAAEKMLLPYEPINVLTTMLMAPLIMSPAIIPALYHGTKSFKEKLPKTAFFQHAVAGVVV